MKNEILIDMSKQPTVLFIGNGVLQLEGGEGWVAFLERSFPENVTDTEGIPFAMRPEAMIGPKNEIIQARVSDSLREVVPFTDLSKLLNLPFDAVITTNYTYEIESYLTGTSWSRYQRKKAFRALDDQPHSHQNTCICNYITTKDGRNVPVFHVHGEKDRKNSLVLSYYSYVNSVANLKEYSKKNGNKYKEAQDEEKCFICRSWLDYFILGKVYAVGFGFDFSEFDIWWAIERKAREKAEHGPLKAFFIEKKGDSLPKETMMKALKAETWSMDPDGNYQAAYDEIYKVISNDFSKYQSS